MRFLFLCAHPDDLEYYIGHILYALGNKNVKQYHLSYISKNKKNYPIEIKIASFTSGEMSDFTRKVRSSKKAAQIRSLELTKSLAELGCPKPDFLGFFDGYVRLSKPAVNRIKIYLQKMQPDYVIAPEPIYTWYTHKDHTNAGKIVYYALRLWHNEDPHIQKPIIYYYTALFNQFFFPKYLDWEESIAKALYHHESQKKLLNQGKIPKKISSFLAGLNISGYRHAQALRRQYRPDIDSIQIKTKLMKGWNLPRKIFYYIMKKIMKSFENIDYSDRYDFIDGTIENTLYPPFLPEFKKSK